MAEEVGDGNLNLIFGSRSRPPAIGGHQAGAALRADFRRNLGSSPASDAD